MGIPASILNPATTCGFGPKTICGINSVLLSAILITLALMASYFFVFIAAPLPGSVLFGLYRSARVMGFVFAASEADAIRKLTQRMKEEGFEIPRVEHGAPILATAFPEDAQAQQCYDAAREKGVAVIIEPADKSSPELN